MHSFLRLSVAACVLLSASAAFAADPLVDVDWVKANLDAEDVVFVDLRPKPSYLEAHIPGAVHTQYGGLEDEWRTKVGAVRGLVRDHDLIAEHLGEIGISNDDHVVLIPAGTSSSDMGAATRIYWTMNYLGHDEVSILNGGMAAYVAVLDADKKPRNPLQAGAVDVDEEDFVAMPRPEMLLSAEVVEGLAAPGRIARRQSHG
ncbi:thiosulfate/3-mercaptopyruvate sulfurtransferase [Roseivivax lentus]|uniref:Thiosulfate/3-mercaptopyruvate sulfurtransferase n=1 Tax=Roseivivax lentus TaxID=633194 RepID=A0A1N7NA72_9RHOB|nr:rhodanese-like domain-containing protein [Roseivivax lentus]SIS95287.1 thiosulfate/3-mercaptopyruvate sulfurtransferase [Roseivivax lentus]